MADKDTPEDLGARGEPVPDGPRSEGGPAHPTTTEAHGGAGHRTADEAAPTPSAVDPVSPVAVGTEPESLAEPETAPAAPQFTAPEPIIPRAEARAPEAYEAPATVADPAAREPAEPPQEALLPLSTHEPQLPQFPELPSTAAADTEPPAGDNQWTGAIAEALTAPASVEPELRGEPAPPAVGVPLDAPPSPVETVPVDVNVPGASFVEPRAAAPADRDAPSLDSSAFTDAANTLFRHESTPPVEETHLITTGRRLNPKLSVPRPTAPEIPDRDAPPATDAQPADLWKARLWTGLRYAGYAAAGYLALVLVLIVLFRFVNPPGSMLMLTKLVTGNGVERTWVPFEAISPALVRAVVVSEDARFCAHSGIDTRAMRDAIEQAGRGTPRGASTISMQVTKNLFLWNAKSYLRKVIEIPLTLVMELVWPKQRILEVYLNIAEWGPGVFGAEAAARHHFKKHAATLSEREAALLAAALPNPHIRVAGAPGPRTSAKARVIQSRVKAYGSVASCVVSAASASAPAATTPAQKTRTSPARKLPLRQPSKPAQQKKKADEGWTPSIMFGN